VTEVGAMAGVDRPLPTGRMVCELPVMVIRQEWYFEPSVRGVLGTNKEPKAEGADGEGPHRGVIAAPTADEPSDNEGDQPDAADPQKVMPHRHVSTCWAFSQKK
jgi:hypothetical protein